MPLPILITALHLVNLAPNVSYSLQRSFRPSNPVVIFSLGLSSSSFTPWSTLIPGRDPWLKITSLKYDPSCVFCLRVSSKRITPPIASAIAGDLKSISLYFLLLSSVDSTSIDLNLFSIVPVLSSAASIPLPSFTI